MADVSLSRDIEKIYTVNSKLASGRASASKLSAPANCPNFTWIKGLQNCKKIICVCVYAYVCVCVCMCTSMMYPFEETTSSLWSSHILQIYFQMSATTYSVSIINFINFSEGMFPNISIVSSLIFPVSFPVLLFPLNYLSSFTISILSLWKVTIKMFVLYSPLLYIVYFILSF